MQNKTQFEVPEWLLVSPPEVSYNLMSDIDGLGDLIEMSRDEFMVLKRHLAAMRGHAVEADLKGRLTKIRDEFEFSDRRFAETLVSAHELYRRCPEVVSSERTLEAILAEMDTCVFKTKDAEKVAA